MDYRNVIAELDAEIEKLQKAKEVLSGLSSGPQTTSNGRRGRTMSAAARARISKAQKARWAKTRAKLK